MLQEITQKKHSRKIPKPLSIIAQVILISIILGCFGWYGINYGKVLEVESSGLNELVRNFLFLATPAVIAVASLFGWIAIMKHSA